MQSECGKCTNFDENDHPLFSNYKGYCEVYKTYYDPHEKGDCRNFNPKFHGSSSDCYITTIVHKILGKEDNTEVLENLRAFRNDVLQKNEKYSYILREYDVIGPRIAKCLEEDNDKKLCKYLYDKYLVKVSEDIKSKNYLRAITKYEMLTSSLALYYNANQNDKIDDYDYTKGGHGKVYTKAHI